MKKQIKDLIIVIVALGIAALGTQAAAEQASGAWVMQESPDVKPLEQIFGKVFVIRKDGSKVLFYNVQNSKIAKGSISGNQISAEAHTTNGTYAIKATFTGSKISGTASFPNGQEVWWKAVKLGALYRCGNHNPAHTATTLKEMKRLTKEKQCAGWSKLLHSLVSYVP